VKKKSLHTGRKRVFTREEKESSHGKKKSLHMGRKSVFRAIGDAA
jgi:hypothetical protein